MSSPRLPDQVRGRLRVKHYSMRTEDTYLQWIRRFVFFHGKKHPRELSEGRTKSGLQPVLYRKPGHAAEFALIIGHQHGSYVPSVCGDKKIVRADRFSPRQ